MSARRTSVADAPLLDWGDALRSHRAKRKRLLRRAAVGAIGVGALLATAAVPPVPRLVWNASASAPIGLYLVSPGTAIRRGDMVIARVPIAFRRFAATRHYLPINVPLVKRVAAVSGDQVCAAGAIVQVNSHPVAARRAIDGAGRAMPDWQGCVRLQANRFFLLMEAPASFDGRYFGVTEGDDIIGKAWPIWATPTQGPDDA